MGGIYIRHFLCTILVLVLLLPLTGCGEPKKPNSDFSAAFTAKNGDETYAGSLTKKGKIIDISPADPYTVGSVEIRYEGDTLEILCAGHSTQANADYLPADSLPSVLHRALSSLSFASYTASENGTDRFILPLNGDDAALTATDGWIRSLSDPHSGWEITFTQVKKAAS